MGGGGGERKRRKESVGGIRRKEERGQIVTERRLWEKEGRRKEKGKERGR